MTENFYTEEYIQHLHLVNDFCIKARQAGFVLIQAYLYPNSKIARVVLAGKGELPKYDFNLIKVEVKNA